MAEGSNQKGGKRFSFPFNARQKERFTALLSHSATVPAAIKERFDRYIREKAIRRAKERIRDSFRSLEEFSDEELETIVQEEEARLISRMKTQGLKAAAVILGLDILVDLLTF